MVGRIVPRKAAKDASFSEHWKTNHEWVPSIGKISRCFSRSFRAFSGPDSWWVFDREPREKNAKGFRWLEDFLPPAPLEGTSGEDREDKLYASSAVHSAVFSNERQRMGGEKSPLLGFQAFEKVGPKAPMGGK